LFVSHFALSAEVVEEVVAVVDNTPILRSDVTVAEFVRLVDQAPGESDTAYQKQLLDARIRLELQYRDLEDSGTLYRLEVDVGGSVSALDQRAGGAESLNPRLGEHGLSRADVEELALRIAAASAYTEQRLRPRITVSLQELRSAYQDLVVVPNEARNLPIPPLTAVRDEIHRLLVERKLNEEIQRWLESAVDRHEVTRFVR